jgi:hypothetical protein
MPKLSFGALLLAVVFAAGCGGGGGGGSTQPSGEAAKPAEQVVADAVKAADAASSVHMSGQVVDGGRQIGVDLSIVRDKGATGTLTLGGAGVDLIVIGNTAYIRGGPDRRQGHVRPMEPARHPDSAEGCARLLEGQHAVGRTDAQA